MPPTDDELRRAIGAIMTDSVLVPELNAHALRFLGDGLPAGCAVGYASSPTCEIGLTDHSGIPYRSIVYLIDACTTAVARPGTAS